MTEDGWGSEILDADEVPRARGDVEVAGRLAEPFDVGHVEVEVRSDYFASRHYLDAYHEIATAGYLRGVGRRRMKGRMGGNNVD